MKLFAAMTLLIVSAVSLSGCVADNNTSAHLSERGRNIEACHSLDHLFMKLASDTDSGNIADGPSYEKAFVKSWESIGRRANSPMGNWMIRDIEAAQTARQNGDTTAEDKGSAANNGETVPADEGSIQTRCENLGVTLH